MYIAHFLINNFKIVYKKRENNIKATVKLSFTAEKKKKKHKEQRQLLSLMLREKKIAFYKRHVNTVQTTIVVTTMIWLNEYCTFISLLDRNFGLASHRHE